MNQFRNPTRNPRDPRQRVGEPGQVVEGLPVHSIPPDVRFRRRLSTPVRVPGLPRDEDQAPDPVFLPPWLFPPRVHFPVDIPQNRVPAVIAAGGSLVITLPEIPQGAIATIRKIGVSTTDGANTRVTTRLNGNPIPPYGGIIGAIGSLENPTELAGTILIQAGYIFSLLLENLSGAAAITMAGRCMGWWWPER